MIKLNASGGGNGIHVISYRDGTFFVDSCEMSENDLLSYIMSSNDAILSEYVYQGEWGNRLFEKTVNTTRVVVAREKKDTEYKIYAAVQRIGTNQSYPVDNGDAGGLVAEIDIETGVLNLAAPYVNKNGEKIVFIDKHPDTGNQIAGMKIPNWKSIKELLIKIAYKYPYINFFAWDIVVLDNGSVCALEVNASSGLKLFQLHRGIRSNELGKLYKSYGVIK